jgi:hypothetical protein
MRIMIPDQNRQSRPSKQTMREAEILDKYSVEHLFLQMEKIRKNDRVDGEMIVTEMTKKRRDNLQALDMCA